jgi:uncharacterized protein (TIGR03437 family)
VRSSFIEVFPPNALALPAAMVSAFDAVAPNAVKPVVHQKDVVIHDGSSKNVSPGALVDIHGTNLPAVAASAPSDQNLPLGLGGSTVYVSGMAAPVVYAGPETVVFQLPYEVPEGQAEVTLSVNGAPSQSISVTVTSVAPELLTDTGNRAVARNQNDTLNTPDNGAAPGSMATVYLTGSGPLDHPVATGAPSPATPPAMETEMTTVTVGGKPAAVSFAGMAPGLVGIVQVTFTVPAIRAGDHPVQVMIGAATSNSGLMTVSN